jgi:hypothetical protein
MLSFHQLAGPLGAATLSPQELEQYQPQRPDLFVMEKMAGLRTAPGAVADAGECDASSHHLLTGICYSTI